MLKSFSADSRRSPVLVTKRSKRALKRPAATIENLAAAVLAEFGIDDFPRRAEERRTKEH